MTTAAKPYYRRKLEESFAARQRQRPAYSLRAFARFLGVQAPTLSAVLAGKRALPRTAAPVVARKLELSPAERARFLGSLPRNGSASAGADTPENSRHLLNEETHHRVIAEWEHYAILALMDTSAFRADATWIGERLGIGRLRADVCLTNLLEAGLLKRAAGGKLVKTHLEVRTTDDVVSNALRQSHREALQMGEAKLTNVPLTLRDFSSMTVAIRPNQVDEAKRLLRKFRSDFAKILEEDAGTEVFQLCLQFYPLTQVAHVPHPKKAAEPPRSRAAQGDNYDPHP